MTKRHSFFFRLFLGNLVIVVVAVLAAAVVSYRAVNDQHLRLANAYQDNLCLIAAQYIEDLWPLPPDRIDAVCKDFLEGKPRGPETAGPTLERGVPARLTVIAADGRVLGDSQGDPARMENHGTEDRRHRCGSCRRLRRNAQTVQSHGSERCPDTCKPADEADDGSCVSG